MKRALVVALVLALPVALLWSFGLFATRAPGADPAPDRSAHQEALPAPSALVEAEAALSARRELAAAADERDAPPAPEKAARTTPSPADTLLVSARLIDEHGEPLPGARLAWVESSATEFYRERQGAAADPAGGVWLAIDRSKVAKETLSVAASAPARARLVIDLRGKRLEGAQCNLGELILPPGGVVEGRVLDADGAPFPAALVGVTAIREPATDAEREALRVWDRAQPLGQEGVYPYAMTGPDGRYRIEGVPIGRFALVATAGPSHAGEAWLPARSEPIEVLAGGGLLAPDLALERPRDADKIEGIVLDPQGAPLAEIVVFVLDQNVAVTLGRTDAAGRFELLAPEGQTFWLYTSREKEWADLPQVQAGTLGIVLRLSAEKPAPDVGLPVY